MEFETLFEKMFSETDHLMRIPLALYYVEEYQGISKQELERIFSDSGVHVSLFALDQYLLELQDDGLIKKVPDKRNIKLTTTGRAKVQRHLPSDIDPSVGDKKLVEPASLEKEHWDQLATEINKSFQHGMSSGAAVLYRTLIEDILHHIFTKVDDEDIQPYTEHDDDSDGNRSGDTLSKLIETLKQNSDLFLEYSEGRNVNKAASILNDMRDLGNDGAHRSRYNVRAEELRDIQPDAKRAVDHLIEILNNIEEEQDDESESEFHGELLQMFD